MFIEAFNEDHLGSSGDILSAAESPGKEFFQFSSSTTVKGVVITGSRPSTPELVASLRPRRRGFAPQPSAWLFRERERD